MPLPNNGALQGGRPGMQPMPQQRPGMPQQGRPGMPMQGQPQQQMDPNRLKAQKLMLKAKLMQLEAQELMMGGGKPQGQGQPPRR